MTKTRNRPKADHFHTAGVFFLWVSLIGVVVAYLMAFMAYFVEPTGWMKLVEAQAVRVLPAYTTVWLVMLCIMLVLWISGVVICGWRMWAGRRLRWSIALMTASPIAGLTMLWLFRVAAAHYPPFSFRLELFG